MPAVGENWLFAEGFQRNAASRVAAISGLVLTNTAKMLLLICNAQLLDLFLEEVTGLELLATLNVKELEDRSVGKQTRSAAKLAAM